MELLPGLVEALVMSVVQVVLCGGAIWLGEWRLKHERLAIESAPPPRRAA